MTIYKIFRKSFIGLFILPKTLFINLKYFPFKIALRLPIIVYPNVCFSCLDGEIQIKTRHIYTGMIKIGAGDVGLYDKRKSKTNLQLCGRLVFKGKALIGHGSKLYISKSGILEIGDKFENTAEMKICCEENIHIGNNVLVSWDTLLMDTDFHHTMDADNPEKSYKYTAPVIVGDNVWIGTRVVILKGSIIPDGCICGASSVIAKKFNEENILLVGNPAVVKKKNISLYRKNNFS